MDKPNRNSYEEKKKEAQEALANGNIYEAYSRFMEIGDKRGLMKTRDLAIERREEPDIIDRITRELDEQNREAIENAMEIAIGKGLLPSLAGICAENLGRNFLEDERKLGRFVNYLREKGYEPGEVVCINFPGTVNAANEIASEYDLGIGVAKGGLYSSWIFNRFGLPVILAEAHVNEQKNEFEWREEPTSIADKINGSNILVLDKDVVTGNTLGRVAEEIGKYLPEKIDLFLNLNPPKCINDIGSRINNVPESYENIYHPSSFSYENFPEAFFRFKEILEERER